MSLQEARRLAKLFPDRFKLAAKVVRFSDTPYFMYTVFEYKDEQLIPDVVFESHPWGLTIPTCAYTNAGWYAEPLTEKDIL